MIDALAASLEENYEFCFYAAEFRGRDWRTA